MGPCRFPWERQERSLYSFAFTNVKAQTDDVFVGGHIMASINLRIDDSLKKAAYDRLSELGVTPSDLIRQTFEYVVATGKLPVRRTVVSDDGLELLAVVRERLASPEPSIPVSLDDL